MKNILLGTVMIVGICLLYAIPFMLLWNWLLPRFFGVNEVSLIEAFGFLIFISIARVK
jgi:hypothetical protein